MEAVEKKSLNYKNTSTSLTWEVGEREKDKNEQKKKEKVFESRIWSSRLSRYSRIVAK